MQLREAVSTGWTEIYSHKMRSFLSFAAIGFGVAAILYTFAIVNKSLEKQRQAFDLVGPGPIQVTAIEWRKDDDKSLRLSRGLTLNDAQAIRQALPWLHMVSPVVRTWSSLSFGKFHEWISIRGVTEEWKKRNWVYTLRGRYFNSYDFEQGTRVCVLMEPGGWTKGKSLMVRRWSYYQDDYNRFVTHNKLINQDVAIGGHLFTVIGILKEPPKDKDPRWFQTDWNTRALMPLKTAQRYFNSGRYWGEGAVPERVTQIDLDTGSLNTVPTAMRRLQALFNVLHRGEKDFNLLDLRQDILNKLSEMREQAMTILSLGIIAILAGGVGIMNVTLATVFSRIREIGTRRALGASRIDILLQFIIEAMLLGLLGGVIGIVMGFACLIFIAEEGIDKLEALRAWHVASTMLVSLGASFIFSLYPAYSASRLDPVEALRYE